MKHPGLVAAVLALTAALLCAEEAPSLDKLIEQLSANEYAARREAAYQIGRLGHAAKPAVPALAKALNDPDKQVWSLAVGILADLGPDAEEALPTLIDSFDARKNKGARDRDRRQIIMRSAYAISRIGPGSIPKLIEALKNEDGTTRAGAARALGGMGPAAHDAIPGLVENLKRDNVDERRETIDALGQMGHDAVAPLGEALSAGEPLVRAGAAQALAELGHEAQPIAGKLADAVSHETDATVRAALLSAVPKVGVEPQRAVELLVQGVKDDNEQVRHSAINAIFFLRSASDRLIPALVALVRDPNPALSERGAAVLGRLGSMASSAAPAILEAGRKRSPMPPVYFDSLAQIGPAAVPEVLRTIEKENPDTLTRDHWSVKCIETIGGQAVTPLAQALSNPNLNIRLVAARGLGQLGPVSVPAFKELAAATNDADPRVRAAALFALVNTHVQVVAEAARVETGLKDASPLVRAAAAQLVPSLGDQARSLAPTLLATLGDHDVSVRNAVVEALAAVGSAAEPAVPRLLEVLPSSEPATRVKILAVFTGIGPNAISALPEIKNRLKDPEAEVRAAAIPAFAKIAPAADRLPVLRAALDDPAMPVRKAAATQLAPFGDKARDASERLTDLLQNDDERDYAFDTLKQIAMKSVPSLTRMLGDRDLTVKIFACQRLARLGPEAKDAAPALQALLQSPKEREELKKNAREALKHISP